MPADGSDARSRAPEPAGKEEEEEGRPADDARGIAGKRDAARGRPFPTPSLVAQIAPYAGAAYTLTGGLLGLGLLGYGLDRWLGTEPWGLLGGLLLGMVVGFYELAKVMLRAPKR